MWAEFNELGKAADSAMVSGSEVHYSPWRYFMHMSFPSTELSPSSVSYWVTHPGHDITLMKSPASVTPSRITSLSKVKIEEPSLSQNCPSLFRYRTVYALCESIKVVSNIGMFRNAEMLKVKIEEPRLNMRDSGPSLFNAEQSVLCMCETVPLGENNKKVRLTLEMFCNENSSPCQKWRSKCLPRRNRDSRRAQPLLIQSFMRDSS